MGLVPTTPSYRQVGVTQLGADLDQLHRACSGDRAVDLECLLAYT